MIKAVAFDYGGVIEKEEGDAIKEISNLLSVSKEAFIKVYFSLNYLSNTGKKTGIEILALTAKEFNASDEQIARLHSIIEESRKTKKLDLEVLEIIKDLKSKNYKIGLLSNSSVRRKQELISQNILDLFDVVLISSEVGYQKPQPEIFEILTNKLGVRKNEMIFIDDTPQSLLNADKIGYVPLLYLNNEKLKKDLADIL